MNRSEQKGVAGIYALVSPRIPNGRVCWRIHKKVVLLDGIHHQESLMEELVTCDLWIKRYMGIDQICFHSSWILSWSFET